MSAPPPRPIRYRPVSHERRAADTETSFDIQTSESPLPLVLQCVICFRNSTWYNPACAYLRGHNSIDIMPSLSISSRSTASEPSSVQTDFFSDSLLPSSTGVPIPDGPPNTFSDKSDGTTPVVTTFPSVVSDCPATPKLSRWTGGELRGVCTTCHRRNNIDLSDANVSDGAVRSSAPLLSIPQAGDTRSENSPQSRSIKTISPLSSPKFRTLSPDKSLSKSLVGMSSPVNMNVPLSSVQKSECSPVPLQTLLANHALIVNELPAKLPGEAPLLARSNSSRSHRDNFRRIPVSPQSLPNPLAPKAVVPSDDKQSLACPINLDLSEPQLKNSLAPARTLHKSQKRNPKDLEHSTLPSGTTIKSEGTSSDSSDSFRQETRQRGTNLRMLLREAKIPQSDSEESLSSGRRLPTAVDMWQAAMIATPRDHHRGNDFSNWQVYHGAVSPFYHHLHGLSASTTSLAGKETLRSASNPSFRDPSPGGPSQSDSPPSEGHSNFEVGLLSRRPSHGRNANTDPSSNIPSSEIFPSFHLTRCIPDSAPESQEVLKGSALAKSPRPSASHVNLITRFTNLHQNASKIVKKTPRRPNTASGTTESAVMTKASPKPGARGTPTPNVQGSFSLSTSTPPTGSLAVLTESRVHILQSFKRPATATGSGSALSLSQDVVVRRSPPIQKPSTAKTPLYIPTLPTIQGRGISDAPSEVVNEHNKINSSSQELHISSKKSSPGGIVPIAIPNGGLSNSGAPTESGLTAPLSQSVPNASLPSSKRNAFYGTVASTTSDQLITADVKRLPAENSARLLPEDFHSKSRNFTLSILPRPSSASISPGQKISAHVKLSSKVKVRKYTSICLLLIGNTVSEGDPSGPGSHNFLRQSYMIHPTACEEVRVVSNSGDLCEWHVELSLPQYANCTCQPGPLPLPSTGTHVAGEVCYSLQLCADRKQLLSNQEFLGVKLNVITQAEARYQVTTKPAQTRANKGRIPFAGGYLGAIEQLSLSHQVYYQSADRLRIGYQFELLLAPNSFLPPSVAEQVSKATKLEIHSLTREQSTDCGLTFTDHRSKVALIPPDERGDSAQWIIKGFLELKAVAQQMKALKLSFEGTPQTPRRAETAGGARSILNSSVGSSSLTSPASSSANHSLLQETERQARLNFSQLFLTVNVNHLQSVFTKPFEISSLIGSELLSSCSLRKLGDEMMKRAIMAEKMKRVQEENSKNNQ